MVNLIGYKSEGSSGEYSCADCGHILALEARGPLPECPNSAEGHDKRGWWPIYGRTTAASEARVRAD